MKIAVIGSGYVGLVSGTCLAETGNTVVCVDNNVEKVETLKSGEIPIYEPGLETLFKRNIQLGRLQFTSDLKEGIANAELIFLALPTPSGEDGSADLSYIEDVSKSLSFIIERYTVIITKSTVPVGSGDKIEQILRKKLDPALFDVVSNPEFLREGAAVADFMKPDRIVIGTESKKAKELLLRLYQPYVRQNNPIYFMDRRSSELTKYASNSYLATRISFMNEVANLCEIVGADIDHVRIGMGSDSRIGKRFLFPGIGYGGSCFPKDVRALVHTANTHNYNLRILNSVKTVNQSQKKLITYKMDSFFNGNLSKKKIAIWGLSFKPNTDDIREAPALEIIDYLLTKGAKIRVYDPEAMINVRRIYKDKIEYASDQYEVIENADALVVATEWPTFRTPDFPKMKALMNKAVIFDGRNIINPDEIKDFGFYYNSIGKAVVDGVPKKSYNSRLKLVS